MYGSTLAHSLLAISMSGGGGGGRATCRHGFRSAAILIIAAAAPYADLMTNRLIV